MKQKYTALITKIFTDGQAMADMVKGRQYEADKDEEYFIGEFGDAIYIPKEKFDEFFKVVKIKSYQQRAKKNYVNKQFRILLTFFPEDKDLLEWLDSKKETAEEKRASKGGRGGRTEYIRQLIREDMQRNKGV
jgi:phosphoglycolate phosphatase-like HAD superfamily hydrolase